MVLSVRERLDLALPVIRASSSSEPGAFSAMTRSSSRLPADKTLANDSVEVAELFAHAARAGRRAAGRVRQRPSGGAAKSRAGRRIIVTRADDRGLRVTGHSHTAS